MVALKLPEKYQEHRFLDVLQFHFGHLFCSYDCAATFVNRGGESKASEALRVLFGRPIDAYSSCESCAKPLSYDMSAAGWGLDRGTTHTHEFYLRTLAARGAISSPERLKGYTKGVTSDTGVGIFMPGSPSAPVSTPSSTTSTTKDAMPPINNTNKFMDRFQEAAKADLMETKKRTVARQIQRTVSATFARLAAKGGGPNAEIIGEFLMNNPIGKLLVGGAASMAPELLPDGMRTPQLMELFREVRLQPLTELADEISEELVGPLRGIALDFTLGDGSQKPALAAGTPQDAPALEAEQEQPPAKKPAKKLSDGKKKTKTADKTKTNDKPPVKVVTTAKDKSDDDANDAVKVQVRVTPGKSVNGTSVTHNDA